MGAIRIDSTVYMNTLPLVKKTHKLYLKQKLFLDKDKELRNTVADYVISRLNIESKDTVKSRYELLFSNCNDMYVSDSESIFLCHGSKGAKCLYARPNGFVILSLDLFLMSGKGVFCFQFENKSNIIAGVCDSTGSFTGEYRVIVDDMLEVMEEKL